VNERSGGGAVVEVASCDFDATREHHGEHLVESRRDLLLGSDHGLLNHFGSGEHRVELGDGAIEQSELVEGVLAE
jgi:hypothetical protein